MTTSDDDESGGKPRDLSKYMKDLLTSSVFDDVGWYCLHGRTRHWISSISSRCHLGSNQNDSAILVAETRPKRDQQLL